MTREQLGGLCHSLYTPEERIVFLENNVKKLHENLTNTNETLCELMKILSDQDKKDK